MAFELTLLTSDAPIASGGTLRVAIHLRNRGEAELEVPMPGGRSSFRYTIFAAEDGRLVERASLADLEEREVLLVSRPEIPKMTVPLPPGLTAVYEEDVTSVMRRPLEPGKYLVQCTYRTEDGASQTSPRVSFEIALPEPLGFAQDISMRYGRIAIAEWHTRADGSRAIRKRESGETLLGRFHDLHSYQPAGPLEQTAISLDAAYGVQDYWRWLAWIEGGRLFAGLARREYFLYPTGSIELDLDSASLLPYGYTYEDGSGLFIVAGTSSGVRRIRLVRIPPGRNTKPVFVDVRFDRMPNAVPSVTAIWEGDQANDLLFSWVLHDASVNGIVQARADAFTGQVISQPVGVFKTGRHVVETSIPSIVRPESGPQFQALLGPERAQGRFSHAVFNMNNPVDPEMRDLPLAAWLPSPPIERWVLPSTPYATSPVVAVAGSNLWEAGQDSWRRIAYGDVAAESVRLWVFSERAMSITWFDARLGYQAASLTPGRIRRQA